MKVKKVILIKLKIEVEVEVKVEVKVIAQKNLMKKKNKKI